MERVKKDFETLAEEAIDNIRADRDQTKELLLINAGRKKPFSLNVQRPNKFKSTYVTPGLDDGPICNHTCECTCGR